MTVSSAEVRAFSATLPQCWRDDYRLGVARSVLTTNAAYTDAAYDALPTNRGNFLRGNYHDNSNQVHEDPMLSRYRNSNNGDQTSLSVQDVLDLIAICAQHFQNDQQQLEEFTMGLQDLLGGQGTATDQRGNRSRPIRLPRTGLGRSVSQMSRDNNAGSSAWRDEDDYVGRPNQDNSRAMGNRRRRPAQDAALADARQQRETNGFLLRFPGAAMIRFGPDAY